MCTNQTLILRLLQSKIHLLLCMCVLSYPSFVWISAYPSADHICVPLWHSRELWRFGGWIFRRKQSGKHRQGLSSNRCCRWHYQSDPSGIGPISKCCRIFESSAAHLTALFSVLRADQYLIRRVCVQFCGPPQCRRHWRVIFEKLCQKTHSLSWWASLSR